jgi:excisionase family DNA binding protein
MSRAPRDPDLIDADEVAALLGVDRKSVYAAAARGELPHLRVGRLVLFSRRALSLRLHGELTAVYSSSGESPRHEETEADHGRLS